VKRQFAGELRAALSYYDPFDIMAEAYARTDAPDSLGRILQLDIATYLCDDILTKVDRASMAVSLEVRSPLLDHCLVEFAARIPTSLKLRNGKGKWILRQAIADRVPQEVVDAPKRGFDVPLRDWTRRELRGAIEQAVNEAPTVVFDRAALSDVWRNHLSGHADHTEFLWAVLVLDRWRQAHGIPLT
jgi:asparagine synthase (glutamine-hydrolysing)